MGDSNVNGMTSLSATSNHKIYLVHFGAFFKISRSSITAIMRIDAVTLILKISVKIISIAIPFRRNQLAF